MTNQEAQMSTAADLLALSLTDVTSRLSKEDLTRALSSPPFVYVPGTFNTRDLGLLPPAGGANSGPRIKPGLVFRTGSLGGLTDEGKEALRDRLKVRKIFDLRSIAEHAKQPDPAIEGIEVVWTPSQEADAMVELSDFVEGKGEKGYAKMYTGVLGLYRDSYRDMLTHVRDAKDEPFLFHCSAGRDRTGVAAAMLLALAGADADTIALDFMLSRVGTEPAREQLLAFAMHGAGVDTLDAPGFYNLCSLTVESWRAVVAAVDRDYGGWEGYVTQTLGFSEEDLVTIKKNLTE